MIWYILELECSTRDSKPCSDKNLTLCIPLGRIWPATTPAPAMAPVLAPVVSGQEEYKESNFHPNTFSSHGSNTQALVCVKSLNSTYFPKDLTYRIELHLRTTNRFQLTKTLNFSCIAKSFTDHLQIQYLDRDYFNWLTFNLKSENLE